MATNKTSRKSALKVGKKVGALKRGGKGKRWGFDFMARGEIPSSSMGWHQCKRRNPGRLSCAPPPPVDEKRKTLEWARGLRTQLFQLFSTFAVFRLGWKFDFLVILVDHGITCKIKQLVEVLPFWPQWLAKRIRERYKSPLARWIFELFLPRQCQPLDYVNKKEDCIHLLSNWPCSTWHPLSLTWPLTCWIVYYQDQQVKWVASWFC